MNETIIIALLLLLLVVLGFFVCTLVLSIIALIRTRGISALAARLDRLERELARLRPGMAPEAAAPVRRPTTETVAEVDVGPEVPEVLPVEPAGVRGTGILPVRGRELESGGLENWIGRRALGWVAVVLLLAAAAFFIQYAFANDWIGELGQVAIGIVAGAAFCGVGLRYHLCGWRIFSQMLSAAGVVLLFLATFGAFGYYHLVPREWAAIFLVVIVIETAALAVLYEAPAIALMAVIGGLLNPVLLHSDQDQYRALFTYLVVLNAGVVVLALFRRWAAIATVALVGTQGLFWGWYAEHYHPEKLWAAVGFQAAIFGLYLAYNLVARVLRQPVSAEAARTDWQSVLRDVEDYVRLVLNAILFSLAGYFLLDDRFHVWMGTFAVGMAVVYTALGWLLLRWRPQDQLHVLVVTATGLAFLAMAFPLQAEAAWIALGWAVMGLALWWFGLRARAIPLRGMAVVMFVLAVGRLLFVDTFRIADRAAFVPIFNKYCLPALAVAGCVLGSSVAVRRLQRFTNVLDRIGGVIAGLGGVLLVWFVLSFETYQYFDNEGDRWVSGEQVKRLAQTSLSVIWAVYAGVILAVGFWLGSRPLRWMALGLFAVTLGKVVLIDM